MAERVNHPPHYNACLLYTSLYHQQYAYPPETILSHTFYERKSEEFFRFYRDKLLRLDAQPNAAHKKLAELEQAGKLRAVITQNIDGLHQKAGSKRVYELHGSVLRNYCEACGKFYDAEYMLRSDGVPRCSCGGRIKPDVVLYEEGLDSDTVSGAVRAIAEADMLIVGGTSLEMCIRDRPRDYTNSIRRFGRWQIPESEVPLMGKIVETFGKVIQDECDKNPAAARKLLLAGYHAQNLRWKTVPGKRVSKAAQLASVETMNSMIAPLAHAGRAAMVSLFTPCELLQVAGLHPYSCEGFGCFLSGTHAERAFLQHAENEGLPETFCSYHKVFIGAAEKGLMPKPRLLSIRPWPVTPIF